jgi:Ca2+-binding EF-hand superfamily protein
LKRIDKNADGLVSSEELPPRLQGRFQQLDANSDGYLDEAEFLAALKPMTDRLKKWRAERGGRGGPPRDENGRPTDADGPRLERANWNSTITSERLLARLDKDQNGEVTKDEAPPRLQEHFQQMDANQDGVLDRTELQTVVDKMREMSSGRSDLPGKRDYGDDNKPRQPKRPGSDGSNDGRI